MERKLYDELNNSLDKTQQLMAAARLKRRSTCWRWKKWRGEKSVGFISRAQDADPIFTRGARRRGDGSADLFEGVPGRRRPGLRYDAFERYTKLAGQSAGSSASRAKVDRRISRSIEAPRSQRRISCAPFARLYDGMPWSDVTAALHDAKIEKPQVPAYADFVDRTVTGQEDLLIAFQELFTAPTARHVFSFALAAFIEHYRVPGRLRVRPVLFRFERTRLDRRIGRARDGLDEQVFVRGFLHKLTPTVRGMAQG